MGRFVAHLVFGPFGGTWQQGTRHAEVYDCHIDNGSAAVAVLLCLLLFRRLGVSDHG